MLLEEVRKIVTNPRKKRFRVKTKDGRTLVVRLWVADNGCLGIMNKGARTWGRVLEYYVVENWDSLTPCKTREIDKVKRIKKRAEDAVKMLDASGLWPDIKNVIEHFLSDEKIIREVCEDIENGVWYDACCHKDGRHYDWARGNYQIFESFYAERCWESITWNSYCKELDGAHLQNAIKERKNYHNAWKNRYDCSVELNFDNGIGRGWFSKEYVGCANGWYYLLFDHKHAIFYEKD